jgi:hypothetical protein
MYTPIELRGPVPPLLLIIYLAIIYITHLTTPTNLKLFQQRTVGVIGCLVELRRAWRRLWSDKKE